MNLYAVGTWSEYMSQNFIVKLDTVRCVTKSLFLLTMVKTMIDEKVTKYICF